MSTEANQAGLGRADRHEQDPRRHKALRFLLRAGAGLMLLLVVAVAGVYWYSTTPAFENRVRGILVSTLEDSVGGRVELGTVRWHIFKLDFEIDNLTIHGLEAANEVPYAHLDKLHVRVKIISLFRAKVGLTFLGVDRPVVHLIVYKDGTTNQPVPRKKSAPSNKSTTDTLFDLAVDRTEINNGTALLNQQAMPFSLAANDLELGVNYVPSRDHYTGSLSIADITAQRGIAAPLHSRLTVNADAGRNELDVSSLAFVAGTSKLMAHAHLSDFNDPHWQMGAKGTIDLREAAALAPVPGLNQGVVALDLQGKGTKALFTVDGETRLAGVVYRGSGVDIAGMSAATRVHITQDELSLNDLQARLARGGNVDGEAHLYNWLSPAPQPSSAPAAASPAAGGKPAAAANGARQANQVVAQATANPAAKAQVSRGVVNARLSNFNLPTILSIIAPPKFQNLGFATTASGTVALNWTGNASDLAADAKIALNAPAQPANGDVPVNGMLDVAYSGRENSVLVRQLQANTPGTHLQVAGGVGLAAGRNASLQAQVTVSNLGEFNRALIAAGVGANGKKGTQAIPIQLHGQAQFQGTVTGTLADPDVKGHFSVNNFDILLNQPAPGAQVVRAAVPAGVVPPAPLKAPATAPGQQTCVVPPGGTTGGAAITCADPSGQQVPIPNSASGSASPGNPGTAPGNGSGSAASATPSAPALPATIHFDSLTADAEYSPALINVQSSLLVRGTTQIRASGQLRAHQLSRHRLVFDDHSAVNADAAIDRAALTDLFALAGQSLAVTGTLTLHTHVSGTLNNLNGGGHLAIAGGDIYGEPYKSLNADLVYAGRDVGASNLVFLENGGQLTGEGGFNLSSSLFHFKAQGSGFDLAHLKSVKTAPLVIGGQLSFDAQGSGSTASTSPLSSLSVNASAHLVNLSLANSGGGPAQTGGIDVAARTERGNLLLDVTTRLGGATAQVHGTTALAGKYQTDTRLTLTNLDLNPYLQMFNVQGVTAHSQIGGTVTVTGPLGTPKLLAGDAQLTRLEVVAQGIPLATDTGLHARLRGGIFALDPLHISGGGTDLRAQGTAQLFGTDRAIDLRSTGSVDMKIAHALVPDANASGLVSFNMNVGGTIERPDLQGKVSFANVNAAYGDLPNGLT
ncbi:MAG TPA: hypothetical protein VGD62_03265, partial [Acidobacteriaceae bacterium]